MLRGPGRRALTIYGGRSGILSRYFDIVAGSVQVQARTVDASVFNAIDASAWVWQSYDKVCRAFNTVPVSGGGLVSSGLGYGTLVIARPNTAPIVCSAWLVDEAIPEPSGG
jgi:hypothetical protein